MITLKKKKYLAIVLSVLVLIIQVAPVYAHENEVTGCYEPAGEDFENNNELDKDLALYITTPICTIEKANSSTIRIHLRCNLSKVVEKVSITLRVEKLSGSSWVTVRSLTSSESNVSSIDKNWTITGLSSGTYRAKISVVITSNGTSETFTYQSGNITLS